MKVQTSFLVLITQRIVLQLPDRALLFLRPFRGPFPLSPRACHLRASPLGSGSHAQTPGHGQTSAHMHELSALSHSWSLPNVLCCLRSAVRHFVAGAVQSFQRMHEVMLWSFGPAFPWLTVPPVPGDPRVERGGASVCRHPITRRPMEPLMNVAGDPGQATDWDRTLQNAEQLYEKSTPFLVSLY